MCYCDDMWEGVWGMDTEIKAETEIRVSTET